MRFPIRRIRDDALVRHAEHWSLDRPASRNRSLDRREVGDEAMIRLPAHAVVVEPRDRRVRGRAAARERLDCVERERFERPVGIRLHVVALGAVDRVDVLIQPAARRAEKR